MSRRLSLAFRALFALTTSALAFVCASTAHASSGTAIGVDLDYTHGINEPAVSGGTGFDVRLGYKLDLLLAQLTPEVGVGYHSFSGDASAKLTQGIVGGRLQFGKILEPGVYAHLGYGHLTEFGNGRSGVTGDAGVTLDVTILPIIDLGVHAGYNGLLKKDGYNAFDSYVLGVHGTVVF